MANLIKVTGKLFDKRRKLTRKLAGKTGDVIMYWLKRESRTNTFTVVRTFTSGYVARSGRFRNEVNVDIATELDLRTDSLITSHICLGTEVYAVSEGDITSPNDTRFTWLVIAKAVNQIFVAP